MAEGSEVGRLRSQETAEIPGPATGTLHLHGGHLGTEATIFLLSLVRAGAKGEFYSCHREYRHM